MKSSSKWTAQSSSDQNPHPLTCVFYYIKGTINEVFRIRRQWELLKNVNDLASKQSDKTKMFRQPQHRLHQTL